MDSLLPILKVLAPWDVAIFAAIGVAFAWLGLWRSGRPKTAKRWMDAFLVSGLVALVAARSLAVAVVVLADPTLAVGAPIPPLAAASLAVIFFALAVVGTVAYRGGVRWRLAAALALGLVSLGEGVAQLAFIDVPMPYTLDTVVAVAASAGLTLFAIFHWTHRSQTPHPLKTSHPIDY